MVQDKGSNTLVIVLAVVIVALVGVFLLGGDNSGDLSTGDATGTGSSGAATSGASAGAAAPATPSVKSGELELFLRNAEGSTGTTAKVVLLDASYAKFDKDGKFDQDATRYAIMSPHYNKGLTSLVGFPGKGTPKDISVASGEWSEPQLVASKGDKFIVYTYQDTSPAADDNITTAHLMELKDFDVGSSKWVAQDSDGKSYWNLYTYGNNSWVDGANNNKIGYIYDDLDTADSNAVITWYSYNTADGGITADGAIYIAAKASYTGKFKSLSITDKAGHNKKFTTMTKAENYGGADPINIASTVLSTPATNLNWYYVGTIGNEMLTENTDSENNRLTWELETDTYGQNETVNVTMVQNAGAIASSNGAFAVPDYFDVQVGCGTGGGGAGCGSTDASGWAEEQI